MSPSLTATTPLEISIPFAGQELVIPTWAIVAAAGALVLIAFLHGVLSGSGPSVEDELTGTGPVPPVGVDGRREAAAAALT